MLELPTDVEQTVEIAAGGERRVDWRVKVAHEGEAVIRMKALTDDESDAMEMKFPVYVHGMLKMDSYSGMLRPDEDDAARSRSSCPAERRAEETRLEVRYSPTLAGAMVDALPYLVDYPYGCTEQTLNRFLPTVITQKMLPDMGLDLKAIQEKRTNLNAQELGDDGRAGQAVEAVRPQPGVRRGRARQDGQGRRQAAHRDAALRRRLGLVLRLGRAQLAHTTAMVVHGLQIAQAERRGPGARHAGARRRLARALSGPAGRGSGERRQGRPTDRQAEAVRSATADNLDALVYMVLVDAGVPERRDARLPLPRPHQAGRLRHGDVRPGAGQASTKPRSSPWSCGTSASTWSQDDENQTAYLNLPGGHWWYWYGSEFEAQAYYLKLLVATDPQERVAPRLVKYLLNNRKHATYWNCTRDTALVVEAMADYLRASGEDKPDMTVEVWLDGQKRQEVEDHRRQPVHLRQQASC